MTARLDYASGAVTTLTLSAMPGTGTDYTLSNNPTLTFAAGATMSTGEVTLTAVDNQVDAPDKEVTVSATAMNTNGVTNPDAVTVMIIDDEDTPTVTLRLSSDSINESGPPTGRTSTVTATLDRASGVITTLTLSAMPGTGTDYTLSSNPTLTFAAGATDSTGEVILTGRG